MLLTQIKSDTGIKYDLNGITKLLVFDRILRPSSKKKTFERKDNYSFHVTTCKDLDHIYKIPDIDNIRKILNCLTIEMNLGIPTKTKIRKMINQVKKRDI